MCYDFFDSSLIQMSNNNECVWEICSYQTKNHTPSRQHGVYT